MQQTQQMEKAQSGILCIWSGDGLGDEAFLWASVLHVYQVHLLDQLAVFLNQAAYLWYLIP